MSVSPVYHPVNFTQPFDYEHTNHEVVPTDYVPDCESRAERTNVPASKRSRDELEQEEEEEEQSEDEEDFRTPERVTTKTVVGEQASHTAGGESLSPPKPRITDQT